MNDEYKKVILRVHKVKTHEDAWTNGNPDKQYLDVELEILVEELGIKHSVYRIWSISEWEEIKKQGYFVD